jgi:hypothetical protein
VDIKGSLGYSKALIKLGNMFRCTVYMTDVGIKLQYNNSHLHSILPICQNTNKVSKII